VNDKRKRPNQVYITPSDDYYDRQPTPERMNSAMDRTAQYVSGLNPDVDSYSTDDYPHYHHHHPHRHHQHNEQNEYDEYNQPTPTLPAIRIRRHPPGSNDPTSRKFPVNLQPSLNNIPLPSNLHVTIKRNPIPYEKPIIPPDQTVIQPVLYPVAVYVDAPVPQYPMYPPIQPIQLIQPIQEIIKPPSPKKPTSPVKTSYNPPISPRKPVSPVKTPFTPPISPNRYETEIFKTPSPPPPPQNRNKNVSPRRPIHTVVIKPPPPTVELQRIRPSKFVVEEYDDYDEHYRVPSAYVVPKKVVSYRTVPGMTTRELENEEIDHTGQPVYVKSPLAQTVTYRVS